LLATVNHSLLLMQVSTGMNSELVEAG